jgi:hypothetical protein
MENVNIINSVETVSAITAKLLQHVHKNARNVVGMVYVVQWKPVIIVLEIAVLVLQPNIVEIIFVIMAKHAIHAVLIVQPVQTRVEICSVIQQVKHVRLVQPIVAIVLELVEMGRATLQTNHVEIAQMIAEHAQHILIVAMDIVIL